MWGFTRITKGVNSGCYFHRLFVCHDVGLCTTMLRKKEMPRRRQPQIARTQYAGCQNDSVLPLISAWGPWQAHMDAAVLSQIEQERIRASLYQNAQYALNAPPSQTGSARIELVPHRQQSPPLNQRQRAILVGSGVGNISRHGAFSIGSSVHPS